MSAEVTMPQVVAGDDMQLLDPHGLDVALLLERTAYPREAMVVVPVHNGGTAVRRCLDSLLEYTRTARIVVIDDASTDRAVIDDLSRRAASGQIELVRHDTAVGYASTVNEALRLSSTADIALVDSGTEVGPGWLPGLTRIARSRRDVGMVSALFDQPGWPGHLSWAEISRALAQSALPWSIHIAPDDHASTCVLVTREALAGFEESPDSEPSAGRALDRLGVHVGERGLSHLLAPRVYVRRIGIIEFADEVGAVLSGPTLSPLRQQLAALQRELNMQDVVRPRRLYVTHRDAKGDSAGNLQEIAMLSAYQDCYLLESTSDQALELSRMTKTKTEPLLAWKASKPFVATEPWRPDYAETVALIALNLGIELVHIEHLLGHPLTTLPEVAQRLDIPVVVGMNDFYLLCPAGTAIGEPAECGGDCPVHGAGRRVRSACGDAAAGNRPHALQEWHRTAQVVLDAASAVIAPSVTAAELLAATFSKVVLPMRVIEPGCDVAGAQTLRREPQRLPGPTRILTIMDSGYLESTEYFSALVRYLGLSVEWHVIGQCSDKMADVAVAHGPVSSARLRRVAAEIDPDLSLLVETRSEPHSPKLATLWALGLPVLTTDFGAAAAHIRRVGAGGVLLPVEDPEAGARAVADLIANKHALRNLRWEVPRFTVPHHVTAAESYRALYDHVERRPAKRHRLGYMIQGFLGVHGSCEHVRVLRRVGNMQPGEQTSVRQVFNSDFAYGPLLAELDTLLVQRDSSCPHTDAVIEAARKAGVRLVVEIDDDLLHMEAAERMNVTVERHRPMRERLSILVKSADGVLVSTSALGDRLRSLADVEPVVVHNELDPRLWLREIPAAGVPKGKDLRVVYMGTQTHLEDLMLLKPVMGQVAEAIGQRVVLEIIGVADAFDDDDWVSRLNVPGPSRNYPDFVRWMRARQGRWHAAVAPLVDNHFNRAKSDLKLLEYAMLDIPVVASDVGPYRGANHLASLTSNDPTAWIDALTDCLGDRATAVARAKAAREHVLAHRMITGDRVGAWLSAVRG
jgi:hypothetical protein